MGVTFWVSVSTILFLAIVAFKSHKFITAYFSAQQQEIIGDLAKAEEVFQNAQNLYEDYREKMETLEDEAEQILKEADNVSQDIINNTEQIVNKIIAKKEQEFYLRIEGQKKYLVDQLLSKYADTINDVLHKDATSKEFNFTYSNAFSQQMVKN